MRCYRSKDAKNLKFETGDHVRISKYENIFAKGYTPNWSKKDFVFSKFKNTVPWKNIIMELNGEEIVETFYESDVAKD